MAEGAEAIDPAIGALGAMMLLGGLYQEAAVFGRCQGEEGGAAPRCVSARGPFFGDFRCAFLAAAPAFAVALCC